MTKDEALTLARDWIAERPADRPVSAGKMISIIDRALAQPEQEPVGFAVMERPWVGLTDEDFQAICKNFRITHGGWVDMLVAQVEAKLKEKNT